MNFKSWLIKNEVAKARPKSIDVSNLAIGRIGPMGTYGQEDIPSIPAWATASALGAMGKSMRQELGSLGTEPAARLLPLASLTDVYRKGMELPLQIPFVNGKEEFNIARSSDKLVISTIFAKIKNGNPLIDGRVRKPREINTNMPGKFELVANDDKDQNKVDLAKKFTEGLIKVMLMYEMIESRTTTGISLNKIYDIENPQVVSKYFSNKYSLAIILSYNKLQNAMTDAENDYTATDPISNDVEKENK